MRIRSILIAGAAALCIGLTTSTASASRGYTNDPTSLHQSELKIATPAQIKRQLHAGLFQFLGDLGGTFACFIGGQGIGYVRPQFRFVESPDYVGALLVTSGPYCATY